MTTATSTARTARTALPVYAIVTGPNYVGPSVLVGRATSKTAAIALARASGFRVMRVGGSIGLEALCAITRSDSDDSAWAVTVYP